MLTLSSSSLIESDFLEGNISFVIHLQLLFPWAHALEKGEREGKGVPSARPDYSSNELVLGWCLFLTY